MPHSTSDLPSQIAYAASLKAMTSNSSYAGRLNGGGASSTSLDNKWKRASLPAADSYGEYKSPVDSARGRSGSIVSTASTAVIHRKSQYYDTNFAHTREKVMRDAPLIAELRTNVIIKDEYTLVTDLSSHLANRYSKPNSAIIINIDHSSCLALAGTFDPCYILTITTIPQHMSSTQNKRNASLIQTFMADILSVPPDRGVLRFVSIPEDDYATNGNTVAGEIERVEKQTGAEGVRRAHTDSRKTAPSYKRSTQDLERHKANGIPSDDRSEREKRAERRRSTVPPSDVTSPTEVFELAAETGERPSTSQGAGFENGLRMNGISKEDLGGRTPNGRPKTFAAPASAPASSTVEALPAIKPKHISTVAKTNEQKAAHMPKTPRLDTKPARQQSNRANGTPITPVTLKETIVDNPKVLKSLDTESANTSKRRSTMTAMPKVPAPPPIPESKTPKVSKRKSFLAAFRR